MTDRRLPEMLPVPAQGRRRAVLEDLPVGCDGVAGVIPAETVNTQPHETDSVSCQ
ncbi:hypothetical protein [Eubacterium sp. An11]|uniref:hypothetical protein n=1 Tax=Eubacterium sp. An11 TaxID=1965542 RepID=UPI0013A68210|nr:hypothetical protein [Eubacterium sp. An11]